MNKFSVKDFIAYNSPCFGCGELISFYIVADSIVEQDYIAPYVHLKPRVEKTYTSIDLHIGWNDTLRLTIDYKTNSFATNNPRALRKYLSEHQIGLRAECQCNTSMESQSLVFSPHSNYIKAVGIKRETIVMKDRHNSYQVYSNYVEQNVEDGMIIVPNTVIFVEEKDDQSLQPVRLDLPLMPRSKFKTKEKLIEKIKLYLTFS